MQGQFQPEQFKAEQFKTDRRNFLAGAVTEARLRGRTVSANARRLGFGTTTSFFGRRAVGALWSGSWGLIGRIVGCLFRDISESKCVTLQYV